VEGRRRVRIRGSQLPASLIPEGQILEDRRRDDLILEGQVRGVHRVGDHVRHTISGRETPIVCVGIIGGGSVTSIADGDRCL
jgi:hypothetical protein